MIELLILFVLLLATGLLGPAIVFVFRLLGLLAVLGGIAMLTLVVMANGG